MKDPGVPSEASRLPCALVELAGFCRQIADAIEKIPADTVETWVHAPSGESEVGLAITKVEEYCNRVGGDLRRAADAVAALPGDDQEEEA